MITVICTRLNHDFNKVLAKTNKAKSWQLNANLYCSITSLSSC